MYTQSRKLALAAGSALALAWIGSAVAGETPSQEITEARQETQIWTTYALSPYLRASDLKASVHNGKATLTGTVEEEVNKDLARQIAMGVNGIKEVDNQITVRSDYVPAKASKERSFGQVIDDATITAAVKSKLLWSKHAEGMETDVDTKAGRVTLLGSADTDAARKAAGRIALNTHGVTSVDNKLTVGGKKAAAPMPAKGADKTVAKSTSDAWITTKVKSTLLYSSNVHGSDISVATSGGVVTLTGKVDSGAERALAIELANNVRGVKSVTSKGLTF